MKVYGTLEKAQLEVLASPPASAPIGFVYFDSVSGVPKVKTSSGWSDLGSSGSALLTSGGTMTGNLDMGGNLIGSVQQLNLGGLTTYNGTTILGDAAYQLINISAKTTVGTNQSFVPLAGTKMIIVDVLSGGGGGGSVTAGTSTTAGLAGGGGGGGFARVMKVLDAGEVITFSVGGGGAGGAPGSGGSNGGSSALYSSVIGQIFVTPGNGGGLDTPGSTGAAIGGGGGGLITSPETLWPVILSCDGEEGQSARSMYCTAPAYSIGVGGDGGHSFYGIGGRSRLTASGNGKIGRGYGAGGGGAASYQTSTTASGGDGTQGIVIFYEYA